MFSNNGMQRGGRFRLRKWSIRALALAIGVMAAGLFALPAQAASSYQMVSNYVSHGGVQLKTPSGIAFDATGNMYIADKGNDRIVIYDLDGTESGQIAMTSAPGNIAIRNQILYVVVSATDIIRFDLNDNDQQIGDRYSVYDIAGRPITGLDVDSSGNIFGGTDNSLVKIDPAGNMSIFVNISGGQGVAIDEADNIYVLSSNGYVNKWDKNKTLLGTWGNLYGIVWSNDSVSYHGLTYHNGALLVSGNSYGKRGFFNLSATDGRVLGTFSENATAYQAFDIAVHPMTNQIYVLYSNNVDPSGAWVYKDIGTTVTLGASSQAIPYGDPVTFTVTVTANNGEITPTGSVAIKDGGVKLADVNLSGGTASYTTSDLAVGARSITAEYGGGGGYTGDTSMPVIVDVSKLNSTTAVLSSAANIAWGDSVTFTASVSGVGPGGLAPTGIVSFKNGATVLGTDTLNGGTAALNVSNLAIGTHTITAEYGGDAVFASSSNTVSQTVNKAATDTIIETSKNDTVYGEQVTFKAKVTTSAPGGGMPTGNVEFKKSTDLLDTVEISDGEASLAVGALPVGVHTITAEYVGDHSFAGSSGTVDQTVQKAGTTTILSTSAGTSVFGQTVTLTAAVAAVAPSSATPIGTVTFKYGATVLGTVTLSAGTATLDVSDLAVGTNSITALYLGNESFQASQGSLDQTVNMADTSISVSSSQDTSVFGEEVTFTAEAATVSPGVGVPTGVVEFWNGAAKLGEDTLSGGFASIDVSSLAVGTHVITAKYLSDGSFADGSGTASQTVNKIGTTTAVTTSTGTSAFGEAVSFTAVVTPASAAGGTPTGTVIFMTGGTEIGSAELNSDGEAILSDIDGLTVGVYTVTAEYGGTELFESSNGSVQQIVESALTSTTVETSQNTTVFGEQVTITATVTVAAPGVGTPSGDVSFVSGTTILGTVALSGGKAALNVGSLAVGTHMITAAYQGDGSFAASQNIVGQTVNKADTTISVTASDGNSAFGQTVTLSAAIAAQAPGAGTPSGSVTFKNGAATLGTVPISGGTATLDVSGLAVGTHAIAVEYSGDSSFMSSDSIHQQSVHHAHTTTVVVPSKGTNAFGEPVTFTATVSAAAPGAGTPTGTVTFRNGATDLGEITLVGGSASIDIDNLAAGAHTITAEYSGDGSFTGSIGTVLHEVGKTSSSISVTVSHGTSVYGENVTFGATVSDSVYGKGTPSGTVTLLLGGNAVGTGTLDNGALTLRVNTLPVGSHTILAQYSGDSSFAASSEVVALSVNKADTAIDAVSSTDTFMFGEVVTVTVEIAAISPGSGTPAGNVTLLNGTETIGTGMLIDGKIAIDVSDLSVGTHTIDAKYGGDTSFNPSVSQVVVTVDKALTAAAVTANSTNVLRGSPFTLTTQIGVVAPGAGIPSGKVTFYDQHGEIGEVILQSADDGIAELTIPGGWSAGRYELYVEYEGNGQFQGSQSAIVTLTVSAPSSPSPSPDVPLTPPSDGNTEGKSVIPPGESGAVSLGEAITVTIPADMSDKELRMTIEEVTEIADLGSLREALVSEVYEILANLEGTFKKEMTISFLFDPSRLKPDQTAAIFYFDEDKREWIEIGGIVDGNEIAVHVDHLTKFAVFAIEKKPLPEPAEPAEPTVTITDIRGHWGEGAIMEAVQLGMVSGYPDGTFRPDHPITRAEFIVMLAKALKVQGTGDADAFADDAKIGSWAKTAVYRALQAGVISGYEDGTLRPNAPISRAEMAVMTARALGLASDAATATGFADDSRIPQWAKGAAEAIRRAGILSGRGDNQLFPGENATRAEAVTIMLRVLER